MRGAGVELLIYPLEGIKVRQQCAQNAEWSVQIAKRVLQQEGPMAFYRGLSPQLLKSCLKQVWCWPMITALPRQLQSYGIGTTQQQVLTGLSIATVDAAITTPLEKAKIHFTLTKKMTISLAHVYQEGWKGFSAYLAKRSMNWTVFLTAQQHFRDRARMSSQQPLSPLQLATIGTKVALIVSVVSAPFDIASTLKQAHNLTPSQLLSRKNIFKLYRGWPLSALSLTLHNIASIIALEKVGKK
jgi:hypothetical protein